MKVSVIVFPGSNCDRDVMHAISDTLNVEVTAAWHADNAIPEESDLVILPGGFSYGDYLRCGAMAAHAPIMPALREYASRGGLVLGICNGFQILTEMGLLPGALLVNRTSTFICKKCTLRVERNDLPFTLEYEKGQVVQFPIAHHEGRYYISPAELTELEENNQVVFRYANAKGIVSEEANPNGALNNIAGIANRAGNILGLMPHPERASERILGGTDGTLMWHSVARWLKREDA